VNTSGRTDRPRCFGGAKFIAIGLAMLTAAAKLAAASTTESSRRIDQNTPPYVSPKTYVAHEDSAKVIEVTLWLYPHNPEEMDALAHDLYVPQSPNYRRWLTRSQIAARFAPSANEIITVRKFLADNHLNVVRVGNDNFYVRASGTVGDLENAFHVQINDYRHNGTVVRANDRDPSIKGDAALLVRGISGLDGITYRHPVMVSSVPTATTGSVSARSTAVPGGTRTITDGATAQFYSPICFSGVTTQVVSTNGDGEFPIGKYSGEQLNETTLTSPGCAYTPAEIQAAYKLKELYAEGYRGRGQTIVIIDWCGSSTIANDANAFSDRFGLPQLTASNFHIIYAPTPSQCVSEDQVEISLDVEWAHAIAPDADIDLVVPPTNSLQDIDEAEFEAVNLGWGNSVSGSYGSPESETPATYLETENLISEIAAISGISTNFSSGDSGDYYDTLFDDSAYPAQALPPTVNAPADAPWATGVGGVTLALNASGSIAWQAGWGNNITKLTYGTLVYYPPAYSGFYAGSGGGPSMCASNVFDPTTQQFNCLAGYPKPSFQARLPGNVRQVPDISWLADPFTGVVIAITVPAQEPSQVWEVVGGTSLACPMFSALWAIANEEAGEPLGQAAQYLYSMPAETITDIVPLEGNHNVTGSIQEGQDVQAYTGRQMLGGVVGNQFVSALTESSDPYNSWFVISFGTDCSTAPQTEATGTPCTRSSALHTTAGWDNVTGVGVPNAKAFADYFRPTASISK
jgi:subtilase family serine protease